MRITFLIFAMTPSTMILQICKNKEGGREGGKEGRREGGRREGRKGQDLLS